MKPLVFASLLTLPLTAQGSLFQEDTTVPPTVGINVQAGFPQGEAGRDLNQNVGYGAAVSWLSHLGGRHLLRLNLEAPDLTSCEAHTAEVLSLVRGD
jgi:hypothetical protein